MIRYAKPRQIILLSGFSSCCLTGSFAFHNRRALMRCDKLAHLFLGFAFCRFTRLRCVQPCEYLLGIGPVELLQCDIRSVSDAYGIDRPLGDKPSDLILSKAIIGECRQSLIYRAYILSSGSIILISQILIVSTPLHGLPSSPKSGMV